MGKHVRSIIAPAVGMVLLACVVGQTAQAQGTLLEQGTSILAPYLIPTGPSGSGYSAYPQEYVTVSWWVYSEAGTYTYEYTVNNPPGDVLLNPSTGAVTQTPEIVDAFQISIDTTAPGAYTGNITPANYSVQNNGVDGLFWSFPAVIAGSSAVIGFTSTDAPITIGNAQALDSVAPSPWSTTSPAGTPIPVPQVSPEPATATLLALALLLLPFQPAVGRFLRKRLG